MKKGRQDRIAETLTWWRDSEVVALHP